MEAARRGRWGKRKRGERLFNLEKGQKETKLNKIHSTEDSYTRSRIEPHLLKMTYDCT